MEIGDPYSPISKPIRLNVHILFIRIYRLIFEFSLFFTQHYKLKTVFGLFLVLVYFSVVNLW
jgi:hypothetical protein